MTSRMFGIALALATTSCRDSLAPREQVQMFVAVEPQVVVAAAPVAVTVTVRNTSSEPASIPSYACPQRFEVRAASGDIVGPEPRACTAVALAPIVLAPGEEWRVTYDWSGGGYGDDPSTEIRLTPGEYRIQGVLYPLCTCANLRSDPVVVSVQ